MLSSTCSLANATIPESINLNVNFLRKDPFKKLAARVLGEAPPQLFFIPPHPAIRGKGLKIRRKQREWRLDVLLRLCLDGLSAEFGSFALTLSRIAKQGKTLKRVRQNCGPPQ
jgi:hypothetical protein